MPAFQTITAANSIFTLAILNLFPTPQQLQGYSADAAFVTEAITSAELVMGVDGNMSAGWVPTEKRVAIHLMPDSPSIGMFDAWYAAQESARELYFASASVILPAVAKEYVCLKGVLTNYTPIAEVAKVLRARTFGITFQSVLPAPV